ncbi:SWIM zinc finger family protein [Haladaptatus sp. DFWS20]|uniref:SWIM zinc finger family protein n=1 Tax=Haladaptatus sp. DFWS20 TaxID=3403467 RepID=UPI003EC0B589
MQVKTHTSSVSLDNVIIELMACTCPNHVHRNAYCKHMAAVENGILRPSLQT